MSKNKKKIRKFRLWDTILEGYVSNENLTQCFLCGEGEVFYFSPDGFKDVTERFDVEFSIGIGCKNKSEVYEGDEMSCEFEEVSPKTGYIEYWKNHTCFVLADSRGICIGKIRNGFIDIIKQLPKGGIDGKVVGNIHDKEKVELNAR